MAMIEDNVIVGVDAHTDTHDVAVLDDCGRLLGTRTFQADPAGYRQLLAWARGFGPVAAAGVESTGSYAAGLVRYLRANDLRVLEVNQPHAHTRRRRGKSDPIDAEMAARHVLGESAVVIAKDTTGIVESIRQLRVARDGAVKARSAALNALTGVIVSAPDELRHQLTGPKTTRARASLCARLRPDHARLHEPAHAAKAALRSLARRVVELETEIKGLDRQLGPLVAKAAPRTTALLAVSTGHAGQLLVTAGQNVGRLASDASFAALCGASPIPVSTGRTDRHRLNYGGDRDANRALHMIAVCRLRYCERTRAYAKRRTEEGKTKKEIIRCLKRYIAREVYHALQADLNPTAAHHRRPAPTVSIACGAGPIGRTVRST
ncbi:MAG: IS110 family transposase [Actinobacteria bacterium]|nr:IS110 family transposase [Actinomycetota bacterium]